MFVKIETYYNFLTRQSPGHRYRPEPPKSILIVNPDHIEAGKEFGDRHGFKLCTDARHLGGYIGYGKSNRNCLRESMETWEKNIGTIIKTAEKYPQESYVAVACAIQS